MQHCGLISGYVRASGSYEWRRQQYVPQFTRFNFISWL